MSTETMLVRLHPYNVRQGRLTKSYTFGGIKFKEETGWYRVPAALADQLAELYYDDDIHSGTIFEVKSESEAVRTHEREQAAKEKSTPHNPARLPDSSHKAPRKIQGVTSAMSTADLRPAKHEVTALGHDLAKAPAAPTLPVDEPADDGEWEADMAADNEAPAAFEQVAEAPVTAPAQEPVAVEAPVAAPAQEPVAVEAPKPLRVGPPSRLSKPPRG